MARKSFQEIRADLISRGAERKSEENFRSLSNEKSAEKRPQCVVAPRPSGFSISSLEEKTLKQPCINTLEPVGCDVSSMENRRLKKQYRTASEFPVFDISYIEKKTLKKTQNSTAPEPPYSGNSSIERKTLKKPQYRTAPEPPDSDIYSTEKNTLKKPQGITLSKLRGSDVSSMENKTMKNPLCRTAPEPTGSNISSMEKRTVKKPQNQTTTERLGSGISSMEKMTLDKPWCSNEPEPHCSDISSQDKKMQNEHQSRTAPEPPGSDISSGATLASAADTFTGSSIPDNGNASTTGPCTGFSTVQAAQTSGSVLAADTCIELTAVKTNFAEKSVSINGCADGSSLGESKPEKADEVPGIIIKGFNHIIRLCSLCLLLQHHGGQLIEDVLFFVEILFIDLFIFFFYDKKEEFNSPRMPNMACNVLFLIESDPGPRRLGASGLWPCLASYTGTYTMSIGNCVVGSGISSEFSYQNNITTTCFAGGTGEFPNKP